MYLKKLELSNFRNYETTEINFSSSLNLIYGLNAQGKTNLLEAIYLLCLGRSFRMAQNQEMLKHDSDFFTIGGGLTFDNEIEKETVLRYIRDGKKEISIDRKKLKSHSELIGQFPIVIMAPDEFKITKGRPSERRRFINILLSQVSIVYLKNLQEYHRILKQRNKILQNIKSGMTVFEGTLEPWTEKLVKKGSEIIRDRGAFIVAFSPILNKKYIKDRESKDNLEIRMDSTVGKKDSNLEEAFFEALRKVKGKEKYQGSTLIGPHRDDITFEINGRDLRKFGSRGEHKSVLISLKLAEFKFLKEKKEETPLLLLDDCYSELDNSREQKVFDSLLGLGQIFLTSPKEHPVLQRPGLNKMSRYDIENGQVIYRE